MERADGFVATLSGIRPTGVDATPSMVRLARERGITAPLIAGEAYRLPFADAAFDLVSDITVIQHIQSSLQRVALEETARVLKPGGCLILMELIRGKGWTFPSAPTRLDPADHKLRHETDRLVRPGVSAARPAVRLDRAGDARWKPGAVVRFDPGTRGTHLPAFANCPPILLGSPADDRSTLGVDRPLYCGSLSSAVCHPSRLFIAKMSVRETAARTKQIIGLFRV